MRGCSFPACLVCLRLRAASNLHAACRTSVGGPATCTVLTAFLFACVFLFLPALQIHWVDLHDAMTTLLTHKKAVPEGEPWLPWYSPWACLVYRSSPSCRYSSAALPCLP